MRRALLVVLLLCAQQVFDAHGHLVDGAPDLPQLAVGLLNHRVVRKSRFRQCGAVVRSAAGSAQTGRWPAKKPAQRSAQAAQQHGQHGHAGLCAVIIQHVQLRAGIQGQPGCIQRHSGNAVFAPAPALTCVLSARQRQARVHRACAQRPALQGKSTRSVLSAK